MDFPFGLNIDTDLSLGSSRDADFFLNSLHSLNTIPPVTSSSNLPSESRREKAAGGGTNVEERRGAREMPGTAAVASLQPGCEDVVVKGESAVAAKPNVQEEAAGVGEDPAEERTTSEYTMESSSSEGS